MESVACASHWLVQLSASGFPSLPGCSLRAPAWRRWPRGRSFLCSCKERNQRNTPQAARPPRCALRVRERAGNYVRHILVPYENAVIHDGALRVLPGPFAVPHGDPKGRNRAKPSSDASGVALGPPEVRQSRRVKPAGRRTGRAPFSYGPEPAPYSIRGWPLRKFPLGLRTRRVRRADRRGVLSLPTFFAQAKKCFSTAVWLVK
jgi:hypothetical protein